MARATRAERADLDGAAGVSSAYLEAEADPEAEPVTEPEDQADEPEDQADDDDGAEPEAEAVPALEDEPRHYAPPPKWRPEYTPAAETWAEMEVPAEVRRYLKQDESRAIALRQHWVRLVAPGLAALGGLALAAALNGWAYSTGHASPALVHSIWLAYLAGLGWAAYKYGEWRQTWFIVTGHRVMLLEAKHLFGRDITMLPIPKMRDVAYRQTTFGRFLGYATFDFASIGTEKALDLVPFLPWPEWLYQEISDLAMPTPDRKVLKGRRR